MYYIIGFPTAIVQKNQPVINDFLYFNAVKQQMSNFTSLNILVAKNRTAPCNRTSNQVYGYTNFKKVGTHQRSNPRFQVFKERVSTSNLHSTHQFQNIIIHLKLLCNPTLYLALTLDPVLPTANPSATYPNPG